jgi:hypothetical protein
MQSGNAARAHRHLLRALIVAIVLLLLLDKFGKSIGADLVPLFTAEINLLAPEFTIWQAETVHVGQDAIRIRVYVSRPIRIGEHELLPTIGTGQRVRVVTLSYPLFDLFMYWPVALIIVFSWPTAESGQRELLVRLLLSIPMVLLLILIDRPLAAVAALWNEARRELGAQPLPLWPIYEQFLQGGGGIILACLTSAFSVFGAKALQPTTRRARTSPTGKGANL